MLRKIIKELLQREDRWCQSEIWNFKIKGKATEMIKMWVQLFFKILKIVSMNVENNRGSSLLSTGQPLHQVKPSATGQRTPGTWWCRLIGCLRDGTAKASRDLRVHVQVRNYYWATSTKTLYVQVSEGAETKEFEGNNVRTFKGKSKVPTYVGDLH